ncbi:hypothetical protein ACHAXN_005927 [Cyclotella atomus]
MSDDRPTLDKQSSNAALSLDEKIQRKLDRETGGRRRGNISERGKLALSMPPQASGGGGSEDPDREAIRKSLMEKRKNMPITKHLSASMKMQMTAEELAKLAEDSEEEEVKGWECQKCTFVNENMDHLACSVCSAPRYKK